MNAALTPDAGSVPADLERQVRAWVDDDPDPAARAELVGLLAAGDVAELRERFAGRLAFGTAGLRGPLGAGPARMNRAVVSAAAAGFAAYLRSHGAGGDAVVAVGYDARHGSSDFAADTAAILAGAGLHPAVLPGPLPTPVLAFAVRHLGAVGGVMVTASHNPATDNGYKVYLGTGSQIVPPADEQIAAAIEAVGPLTALRRGQPGPALGASVVDAYVARAVSLVDPAGPRALRLATTALHGVGGALLTRVLTSAGFAAPREVAAQATPDPDFPTVAFPNPEEPGAMDAVLAEAGAAGADVALATDPDADRCAVAARDGAGRLRVLTGNEVGILLAAHLLGRGARGALATSIVSATQMSALGAAYGLPVVRTLTGFKWIARTPDLVYGYEEALGYCVDPSAVADKDGITAGLLVAELAAAARARGRTLIDELDDLDAQLGVHRTRGTSLRVGSPAAALRMLDAVAERPPVSLGGLAVTQAVDLGRGWDGLPPTPGLRLALGPDAWVVVRPSGTEAKLKVYAEVRRPPDADVVAGREAADAVLDAVTESLAATLDAG